MKIYRPIYFEIWTVLYFTLSDWIRSKQYNTSNFFFFWNIPACFKCNKTNMGYFRNQYYWNIHSTSHWSNFLATLTVLPLFPGQSSRIVLLFSPWQYNWANNSLWVYDKVRINNISVWMCLVLHLCCNRLHKSTSKAVDGQELMSEVTF